MIRNTRITVLLLLCIICFFHTVFNVAFYKSYLKNLVKYPEISNDLRKPFRPARNSLNESGLNITQQHEHFVSGNPSYANYFNDTNVSFASDWNTTAEGANQEHLDAGNPTNLTDLNDTIKNKPFFCI
jgi:hypothetical protein